MSSNFDELFESVQQMDEIVKGERKPERTSTVTPIRVKQIRGQIGLSQERFADLIDVLISTLRNWEQGRLEQHMQIPMSPGFMGEIGFPEIGQ